MATDKNIPRLSIIIPVYNEEDNLLQIYQILTSTMDQAGVTFELIFINDGSQDRSLEIIKNIALTDLRVRYASFSRNFGHEAASSCGFEMVRGQAAVLMDADLQDPPEVILAMLTKWQQGYDVVYARRLSREGEPFAKRLTSWLFYRLINLFSHVEIPEDVGDFRLVDRRVIDVFNRLGERNRFVRGLFSWVGFRQTSVEYNRPYRNSGVTKYNWLRLILLSMDAIFGFSLTPLRLCLIFGMLAVVLSFIMVAIIVIQRLFLFLDIPGYALQITGMFFLGGIQLIFLGVIGEYVGKIFAEVQGRPLFIVEESSGSNEESRIEGIPRATAKHKGTKV